MDQIAITYKPIRKKEKKKKEKKKEMKINAKFKLKLFAVIKKGKTEPSYLQGWSYHQEFSSYLPWTLKEKQS